MGLDSAKEEMDDYENRFLARGLATLSFDGPGRASRVRLCALPEYEKPVKAVFDYLATRSDVDNARAGIWAYRSAATTRRAPPRSSAACAPASRFSGPFQR